MAPEKNPESIYEEMFEEMITPSDHKTTLRIARFLKPVLKHSTHNNFPPNTRPLLSEIFPQDLHQWPSKVIFRGWYGPQKKWKSWVQQLALKFAIIWNKSGIHQAIMASIYKVRSSPETVLGLSEFWCPETNTFLFPWGEATITLEDVMILGGYPVLGECLTSTVHPLVFTKKLAKVEKKFKDYRLKILSKGIKATHHGWLNHFMEECKEGKDDLAHVAFLSIWLSRYVFPSVAGACILNALIPIAVKLSLGIKLALGPAVLASLYRNLTILSKEADSSKQNTINVSGPLQLLQIWAFERFPIIGPKGAKLLQPGEPRVARWDKMNLKLNLPLIRMVVKEARHFCWRPYAAELENWQHPSYCREIEQFFLDYSSLDEELRSFYQCLVVAELIGIDSKEKYSPHRVAMQFGLDQGIPACLSNMNYNTSEPAVRLYFPSRSFQPSVSLEYSKWWKDLMLAREEKSKVVLSEEEEDSEQVLSSVQAKGNSQDCHATMAATNSFAPDSVDSSEFSFETSPPGISAESPLKDTTNANNDDALREEQEVPVAGRNSTDSPTTPPILSRSYSTVSPPPGFDKSFSNAKRRRLFLSRCAEPKSASLPRAKNAKVSSVEKKVPISGQASQAKTYNARIPDSTVPLNVVKREVLSDDDELIVLDSDEEEAGLPKTCNARIPDSTVPLNVVKREVLSDDDVGVVLDSDKKETSSPKTCNTLQNVASSDVGVSVKSSRKRKLCTRESPEVSISLKNCSKSSEVKAQETAKEADGEASEFVPPTTGLSERTKKEAGDTANEPKNLKEWVKTPAKGGEAKLAGDSQSNPINLDEDITFASGGSQKEKQEQDIIWRLEALEKLFGVVRN